MELREILHAAMKHTNAARSALNEGDELNCKMQLAYALEFLKTFENEFAYDEPDEAGPGPEKTEVYENEFAYDEPDEAGPEPEKTEV